MAAGLPPRKELTPEQEEVQKHIYATQTYLDALQRVCPLIKIHLQVR